MNGFVVQLLFAKIQIYTKHLFLDLDNVNITQEPLQMIITILAFLTRIAEFDLSVTLISREKRVDVSQLQLNIFENNRVSELLHANRIGLFFLRER